MSSTLVLLAAGVGSRYGGPKQVDPVGPGGATLIDYAGYDALRVGFTHVVLVVGPGSADAVGRVVDAGLAAHARVDVIRQDAALPDGFRPPPGRAKPWGTGHALAAAAPLVEGSCAVLNADDFYGSASYRLLADWMQTSRPRDEHALVSFELRTTLSPAGPVNRGICRVDDRGFLREIREVLRITADGDGATCPGEAGHPERLAGDTPVSLNFWGFGPGILPAFEAAFRRFLDENAESADAELFLPSVVQERIGAGEARVRVLPGGGPWAGLTHPEDRAHLVHVLEERTHAGEYPRDLWA